MRILKQRYYFFLKFYQLLAKLKEKREEGRDKRRKQWKIRSQRKGKSGGKRKERQREEIREEKKRKEGSKKEGRKC